MSDFRRHSHDAEQTTPRQILVMK